MLAELCNLDQQILHIAWSYCTFFPPMPLFPAIGLTVKAVADILILVFQTWKAYVHIYILEGSHW